MSKMFLKKGDNVLVITGTQKGKKGVVLSVDVERQRAIVDGVNLVSKHTKPSTENPKGGIVKKEAAIDISNVMYSHKGKATRIGFKLDGDKKVRVAKSTGEVID